MSAPLEDGSAIAAKRVAICVATCRRPDGLKRLLESLNGIFRPASVVDLRLIVVDNDPSAPATETLGDVATLSRWPLFYAQEPVPGVVAARNALLEHVPADVEFVAFLDDDEVVTPGWLVAMLETQARTGATAVQGPVRPEFEVAPPDWLVKTGLFELGPFKEGEPLHFAATNNVLVSKRFLDEHDLKFDVRFNRTGGEDEELFTRLQAFGGRICASSEAVVIDQIPRTRMTMRWLMRRSHRMGNTLGRIAILHNSRKAERLAKGFASSLVGLAQLGTTGLVMTRHRVAGAIELARGTGMLTAFLGVSFAEYSSAALSHDRGEKA
ncbi:glycosyltransferase family 2 protein [Amaricoccus macauensis]|uniref:glycosyltransferase family 2 protein n=1 Tax=Amaricoccus macauensis TaxID=57001 RepID=UPI003C7AD8D4